MQRKDFIAGVLLKLLHHEYIREILTHTRLIFIMNGKFVLGEDVINCYHGTVHGGEDLQSLCKVL